MAPGNVPSAAGGTGGPASPALCAEIVKWAMFDKSGSTVPLRMSIAFMDMQTSAAVTSGNNARILSFCGEHMTTTAALVGELRQRADAISFGDGDAESAHTLERIACAIEKVEAYRAALAGYIAEASSNAE